MNLVKNTLIFLFVSAAFACSGNNQSDSATTLAENRATNTNSAANTVNNNNPNSNKTEANVYKDYPKAVLADNDSKNKKLTPAKPNSEKAEKIKKTETDSPSSDDNVFKFSSSKRINSVAPKSMRRRLPKNEAKEEETDQKKDETNQKKDEPKQP